MEQFSVLRAAVLLLFAVYVTGQYYGGQEHVLVDNKCKCIKVTSRFVPSKEDPNVEILERNIKITIPLKSRVNISDPTSPLRTNFVYNLSNLCQKCDPVEIDIGGEPFLVSQGSCSKSDADSCYAYDRSKCYTSEVPFKYDGNIIMRKVPLNSESCYE
ncbi:immunoglobulin J chain [Bufo gargarizans]|uniref:immunoglobulin J chain n=1 Tax=Bufo gargarizans TaxID=30331 RepID=UPI001CF16229|nr:immunoglobulin J chain [Bufo gargarizans]